MKLYYHRPAKELIIMTDNKHHSLHTKGERCHFFGKHLTEEQKAKMREGYKKWIPTEEYREKMRQYKLGTKHTQEELIKMSLSQKGHIVKKETKDKIRESKLGRKVYNNGLNHIYLKEGENIPEGYIRGRLPFKAITGETRNKMSESRKGKVWYHNNEINTMAIEGQQPEGFVRGRLPFITKTKNE